MAFYEDINYVRRYSSPWYLQTVFICSLYISEAVLYNDKILKMFLTIIVAFGAKFVPSFNFFSDIDYVCMYVCMYQNTIIL